jgi:hypothetical protein
MISSSNFEDVFGQMVAGTLPLAAGDPLAAVGLVVRDLLGTDAVHAIVVSDLPNRRVHYFAVPSRALHSTTDLSLPLSAALPAHPAHEGDGCYVMHRAPVSAAAILRGGELRLVVNEATLVEAVVAESGLPAFDVTGLANGWRLVSRRSEIQRLADRSSALVTRWAGGTALVLGVAYAAMSASAAWLSAGADAAASPLQHEAMVREVLNRVQLSSPLTEQLGRLQGISSVVVRAGGWIDSYQVEKGAEHYRVILPEWVTRDYLASLDNNVRADRKGDGTIEVIKGLPSRDGKPSTGAVPVAGPLVPAPTGPGAPPQGAPAAMPADAAAMGGPGAEPERTAMHLPEATR